MLFWATYIREYDRAFIRAARVTALPMDGLLLFGGVLRLKVLFCLTQEELKPLVAGQLTHGGIRGSGASTEKCGRAIRRSSNGKRPPSDGRPDAPQPSRTH